MTSTGSDVVDSAHSSASTNISNNPELMSSSLGSDIAKDVPQLISSLDTIYELHSILPQNKDKELCVSYLKTGACSAKCRFSHPVIARLQEDVLVPPNEVQDLIYIMERTASLIKVVSHDATQAIANVIKPVCQILSSRFDTYMTEGDYGDVAYLYDECSLRVLSHMRSFMAKKPSPKQYFKKVYHVKPPTNSPMEICITELRLLQEKYQAHEDSFHRRTIEHIASPVVATQLLESLSSDIHLYAVTVTAVHEMNQANVHTTQNKIYSVLKTLWDSSNTFTIEHCGLTPTSLSLTPHSSPLSFVISQQIAIENLQSVSSAFSRSGFTIISDGEHESQKMLTMVPSDLAADTSQQLIQLLFNNKVAILNTRLIAMYSARDACVRPLVLAVQQWARVRGCCDPENATLSMYGWTLLVIYFLRREQSVMAPCIEKMGHIVNNSVDSSSPVHRDGQEAPQLAELLIQFFLFYGTSSSLGFQPFHSIASLRNKHKVFKRNSHYANQVDSTLPCMTSLDAIRAISPNSSPEENEAAGQSLCVPPASDNDFGNEGEFLDDDNTDRGISSNTSQQSRNGRRQQMLVYKTGIPTWRFCIEDPLEDVDIGAAIFSRVGQCHIQNELRRTLTLFHDIPCSSKNQEARNYWNELCVPNDLVPVAVKTCDICGQVGHLRHYCELLRCNLCQNTGHFMRDCLLNFCSNCRKQGHLAKDCDLPKICRNCKQTGHLLKDCPLEGCAKCGSRKHPTTQCHQNINADKDILHRRVYKRGKSTDKSPTLKTPPINDHSILPQFQRSRLDSFDIDCDSVGSSQQGVGGPRGRRRRRRPHNNNRGPQLHQNQNQSSLGERLVSAADGKHKESKSTPKENKVVPKGGKATNGVPALQLGPLSKSRMTWISGQSPLPSVTVNTHIKKNKFFTDVYSPQNSPYASPREWGSVAPGKLSSRIAGAMQKPSSATQQEGAKKVPKRPSNRIAKPPRSRSRNRYRASSINATTSAGYDSGSPRIASSPVTTGDSTRILRADSKVIDGRAGPKLGAKPANLKLQKKVVAGAAKAEPRDRTTTIVSSPVRSLHDIKLSSTDGEIRDFTTPHSTTGSTYSSPDSISPGKTNLGAHLGAQVKRENKRLSRHHRKKQEKREGAKRTIYLDDVAVERCDEGSNLLSRIDSKVVSAAKVSGMSVDPSVDDRVSNSGRYNKAEEKREVTISNYADYLDYI